MSVVANLLAAMRIRWRVCIPAARWPEFEHYIQRQHRPFLLLTNIIAAAFPMCWPMPC
jgi:hypothetical protein